MERIELNRNLNLKIHGRISNKEVGGIPLFWSASCLEMNVTGSELYLEYEHTSGYFESYIRIEVDGFDFMRFMLEDGKHKVHILRRFDKNTIKNVRIFREDQASPNRVLLSAIETDGQLMPIEEKGLKIEFVGDSVTAGEGLCCTPLMQVWTPAVFSSRGNYALLTAKNLDADWSIMAKSGWGIHCEGWSNNIKYNMPEYYEYVAATDASDDVEALGGMDPYAFEDPAHITVVNLGSNDCFAFNAKQDYIDEKGNVHRLRLDENGDPDKDDIKMLYNKVYSFLLKIHKYNPDTKIIWCYGMFSDMLNETIISAIRAYKKDTNKAVFALELPKFTDEFNGSRMHPGVIPHKTYSDIVTKAIKEIL